MKHHICTSCGTEIPRGEAVLRSVSFEVLAWHRDCTGAPETQDHLFTGTAA